MLNMVNVCRCFLSIFSNQIITSVVFFHWLSFIFWHKPILILSNIYLLILLILFLVGFINLVVGWLTKFSLWSFKVIKQSLKSLISILSNVSARSAYFMPSFFIISLIPFVVFYMLQLLHCPRVNFAHLLLVYTCLRFRLLV